MARDLEARRASEPEWLQERDRIEAEKAQQRYREREVEAEAQRRELQRRQQALEQIRHELEPPGSGPAQANGKVTRKKRGEGRDHRDQ
jgi:hypothetical protein